MAVPTAARVLLAEVLDYAGTFPPAQRSLPDALAAYAQAAGSDCAWILGRCVLSAGALDALTSGAAVSPTALPVSVVIRPPHRLSDVTRWIRASAGRAARVVSVECPPMSPDGIRAAAAELPEGLEAFFEVPFDPDFDRRVRAIADARGMVKLRTGGVVAQAFPAAEDVVRALQACVDAGLACKATAGLHHALRGRYALTYEPGSATATMHGFLNLVIAAALVWTGDAPGAVEALDESAAGAFRFEDDGVVWRDRVLSTADLADARHALFRSFGSCSFQEPVEELAACMRT